MSLPIAASPALNSRAQNPKTLPVPVTRYLSFGGFQLDTQRELLFKDGAKVRLPGKVFQTLLALLERPGEVLTREALRARLWPQGTFVNYDANVNTTVNKLRLVLGDSPEQPAYIETIPRLGYCFVGSVERVSELSKAAPAVAAGPAKSLGVEPESALPVEPPRSASVVASASQQTPAYADFWSSTRNRGLAAVVLLCGVLIGMGMVLLLHRIS